MIFSHNLSVCNWLIFSSWIPRDFSEYEAQGQRLFLSALWQCRSAAIDRSAVTTGRWAAGLANAPLKRHPLHARYECPAPLLPAVSCCAPKVGFLVLYALRASQLILNFWLDRLFVFWKISTVSLNMFLSFLPLPSLGLQAQAVSFFNAYFIISWSISYFTFFLISVSRLAVFFWGNFPFTNLSSHQMLHSTHLLSS